LTYTNTDNIDKMEMVSKSDEFGSVASDEEFQNEYANNAGSLRSSMDEIKSQEVLSTGRKVAFFIAMTLLVTATSFLTLLSTKNDVKSPSSTPNARWSWRSTLLTDIDVYPGYIGQLVPRGRVTVRFEDDGSEMLMRYELEGLEASCNKCGIHIHQGQSCDDPDLVLGHYFNQSVFENDPWNQEDSNSAYDSDQEGFTSSAFVFANGIEPSQTMGRALVVHSQDGTRIGCGILKSTSNTNRMKARIGAYPGYSTVGTNFPNGTVRVFSFEDDVVRIRATLSGLEPNCVQCGLHIHSGLSCDDADSVGGHWYKDEKVTEDPWAAEKATYTSDSSGNAKASFYVYNGYDYEQNVDHAVVIHGQDGSRIGCGVIKPEET